MTNDIQSRERRAYRINLALTYTYASGRLSTVTSPDGGVATFAYDGSNLLATITEPGNRLVTVTIDSFGLINMAT